MISSVIGNSLKKGKLQSVGSVKKGLSRAAMADVVEGLSNDPDQKQAIMNKYDRMQKGR